MWRKVLVSVVVLSFVSLCYGETKPQVNGPAVSIKTEQGFMGSIPTKLGPATKGDTLGYDDGSAENAWVYYYAGNGWGVKFDANNPVTVDGALIYFWGSDWPSPGGNMANVWLVDDDGQNGAPGTILVQITDVTITRGDWNFIPFSNVGLEDGSFYIFYIQHDDYPYCPGLAIDTLTSPPSGTQWRYLNGSFADTTYGGAWLIRAVVSPLGDSLDPLPPTNLSAYSDYTTPTSITLSWTDPSHYVGGDSLTDFQIEIWMSSGSKDSTLVATVPAGIETDTVTGLSDGTLYYFYLRAKDNNDSTSSFVSTSWYAGGSPYPAPPTNLVGNVMDETTVQLTWINPATQSDGTPIDDLAGINIYVDGSLASTYSTSTPGAPVSYNINVTPGTHLIYITAFDNETPVHESDPSDTILVVTNVHTGGPDGFGYTYIDSDYNGGPSFNWIDITSTGTPMNLGDDDNTVVNLSFSFPFYDTTYNFINIQSNGTVTFDSSYTGLSNSPLPTDAYSGPKDIVAFYWADQNPSGHGQVYFQDFGSYAVVEFYEVPEYGGSTYNTYEVVLHDNGDIYMNYLSVTDYSDETIGIQDASAYGSGNNWYLQYTFDGDPVVPHDSLTIYFARPVSVGESPISNGRFALLGTATNPVKGISNVSFVVPKVSNVNLSLFDITGRKVKELYSGRVNAGVHRVRFDASSLASGVYFIKMSAGSFTDVAKILVVK